MFTIGADPEIFVSQKGKFVSAYNLVPGTKKDPFKVDKGAVQVDGLALEFNIDPAHNYEEFQENLDTVMRTLQEMVPEHTFMEEASVYLDPQYRASLPPESLEIGCSPSLNAYTEDADETPDGGGDLRAVGGHLHIGGFFDPDEDARVKWNRSLRLIRLMDKYVGVYSVLWDPDTDRRKIYGAAGSCRLKSFGVEYRTLSNRWLFDKKITKFIYEQTAKAVEALYRGEDVESDVYKDIINSSNREHEFFKDNPVAAMVA